MFLKPSTTKVWFLAGIGGQITIVRKQLQGGFADTLCDMIEGLFVDFHVIAHTW